MYSVAPVDVAPLPAKAAKVAREKTAEIIEEAEKIAQEQEAAKAPHHIDDAQPADNDQNRLFNRYNQLGCTHFKIVKFE